jgi:type II secretory pathway pseudopilin PulG
LDRSGTAAFTIVEVVVAVLLVGMLSLSLYAGFSQGFTTIQTARENLRATQILLKRMETIRLYTWTQVLDTNNYLFPTFTEYYDEAASSGTVFAGTVQATIPDMATAYQTNMRTITVTVTWTNSGTLVRTREMQTRVARYGMQNYIYGYQ